MKNKIIEEDIKNIINNDLFWEDFSHRTFLITGANGFLPAYMVQTLLYLNDVRNMGIKVIGLVRSEERANKRFDDLLSRKDFTLIIQDVCDPVVLIENIDYIIHAASQASPKYYGIDPVGTTNANVLGTYNLLKLANIKKVKCFLFFSSGEIYGEGYESGEPLKESDYGYIDPTKVRSCYSASKLLGESMCISWLYQYGVPIKVVRPFHTYGPGMSLDDGRVFADFVSDIVNGRNIIMKSDGSAKRAFCYLADAVLGFFTVLLKGKSGEAYNIGNNNSVVSILELANMLIKIKPDSCLKVIKKEVSNEYFKSKITKSIPDIAKVILLGWEPKIQLEEGFKRTIESFEINLENKGEHYEVK